MSETRNPVDLFVIGGGINGCGIARDAAGKKEEVTLSPNDSQFSAFVFKIQAMAMLRVAGSR